MEYCSPYLIVMWEGLWACWLRSHDIGETTRRDQVTIVWRFDSEISVWFSLVLAWEGRTSVCVRSIFFLKGYNGRWEVGINPPWLKKNCRSSKLVIISRTCGSVVLNFFLCVISEGRWSCGCHSLRLNNLLSHIVGHNCFVKLGIA